jgi:hypothetical protein
MGKSDEFIDSFKYGIRINSLQRSRKSIYS